MSLHWRGFHKVKHFKDQNQFSEHLHNSLMITKDSQVNEKILNLTLEIIFLLTGEDFVFVKNAHSHEADSSSPCVSEGLFTVQNPTMELSHDSQIHEKNSDRILDLTNKNMGCENLHPEMLKQSDPELTVIDHRDHTDTHADESSNRNTPERHPIHPYSQDRTEEECRVTQDYQMEADRTFPQRCKEEEIPTEIQTVILGFDDSYLSDNDQRDSEEKRVHPRICADESGNRNTPERRPISPYSQDRIEEEKRITQDCKMEPDDVIFSQQCKEEEIPTDTSTAPEGILSNRFIQKDDGPNVVTNISSSETLRNSLTIIYTDITSHNDIKHTDSQMEHTGTEYSSIFIHKNSKRKTHVPKIQENSSKKKSKYRDYDGNTPDEVDFGSHQRIQDEMSNTPKRQSCFADNSDLTSHQNDVEHQARHRQKKLCQCTECGKIHTGDKPLVCPVCGKSFTKTSNLVAHQRIHTGEKPFVCSICGKCFTATSSLVVHQRIHTGEKPFQCSDCGKCFSFRSGFITHQRTHTGEKPHVCSKCGKSFIQIGHLARHQKIHTSEKKH